MIEETARAPLAPGNSVVVIKTRSGKITTTRETLASCDCDYFDNQLRGDWQVNVDKKGRPKLFLDVDHDIFTDTLLRMQSKVLSAPRSFDEAFVQEQRRQFRFLGHRPTLAGAFIPPGFAHIKAGLTRDFSRDEKSYNYLARPFWCQATPVTQRQWRSLMESNPSQFKDNGPNGELADDCPVEQVTWYDAADYCNALSKSEGLPEYYNLTECLNTCEQEYGANEVLYTVNWAGAHSYRLPTRAEQNRILLGSDPASVYGGAEYKWAGFKSPIRSTLGRFGWVCDNAQMRTHPVGRLLPTNEGVYDGFGNVWEWTDDPEIYQETCRGSSADGSTYRCLIGGEQVAQVVFGFSWEAWAIDDRPSCLMPLRHARSNLGFRVVRSIPHTLTSEGPLTSYIRPSGETQSNGYNKGYEWPAGVSRTG